MPLPIERSRAGGTDESIAPGCYSYAVWFVETCRFVATLLTLAISTLLAWRLPPWQQRDKGELQQIETCADTNVERSEMTKDELRIAVHRTLTELFATHQDEVPFDVLWSALTAKYPEVAASGQLCVRLTLDSMQHDSTVMLCEDSYSDDEHDDSQDKAQDEEQDAPGAWAQDPGSGPTRPFEQTWSTSCSGSPPSEPPPSPMSH